MMRTLTALLLVACLLPVPVLAQTGTRPLRVVLIVDSTEAIRQPIGIIRKALTAFVEGVDAQHEMMLVSVAGTPQIRVRPTLDRQQVVKSVNGIFGTSGSNVMNRVIDDLFHRFAQPADRRPVFRRPDRRRIRVDAEHQPAGNRARDQSLRRERRDAARGQAQPACTVLRSSAAGS